MAKFDVATIKKEANDTYRIYRGFLGKDLAATKKVWQMRLYVRKVLFLCKEIEKLRAKK